MFIVRTIPQQSHIRGGKIDENEFPYFKDALSYFNDWCDAHNLDNVKISDDGECREAGGLGYDYRIELVENQ